MAVCSSIPLFFAVDDWPTVAEMPFWGEASAMQHADPKDGGNGAAEEPFASHADACKRLRDNLMGSLADEGVAHADKRHAVNFALELLAYDPKTRLDYREALSRPFFDNHSPGDLTGSVRKWSHFSDQDIADTRERMRADKAQHEEKERKRQKMGD